MGSPHVSAGLAQGTTLDIALAIATQPLVVCRLLLYGAGAVAWLFVLARFDVSQAYPFVGLGFILTMALGAIILGEPFTARRLVGTLLLAGGVLLVAES
jgi:multidrug transporter EmrE-like cation transporter